MRIAETKKDTYEFKRDIIIGAENPRTGKIVGEKMIRCASCEDYWSRWKGGWAGRWHAQEKPNRMCPPLSVSPSCPGSWRRSSGKRTRPSRSSA
jgi:hypothetical protein